MTIAAATTVVHGEFVHPGISHTTDSIAFVKEKIEAGEQPWTTAWEELRTFRRASLDHQPKPRAHVERGPYNNPNIGSSEFSNDANAAYLHALQWVLSDNEAHAEKSAEILDAWSGTLKSISNHDARLLIGMEGYEYCNAAELLRHTWDGWPKENQVRFEKMLREVFYPVIKDFYPSANGNWDASMIQTMMAMGVFLDDQAMFDRAKDYYLNGKGNGAIGNYFKPSGQCQESGRDQAHTQMGLDFFACAAEIAWNQGVDLYGALDNRLLKGFEYTAKYNLGFEVPYEPYRSFEGRYFYKEISDDSRGRLRPMYEKVLNHYVNRKGLEAPYTRQAVMKLREDDNAQNSRRSSSPALGTLMFSGQPTQFGEGSTWRIEGGQGWETQIEDRQGLTVNGEHITPIDKKGFLRTTVHSSKTKRKATTLTLEQSPVWQNWNPIENLGPVNLRDAPVLLTLGPVNLRDAPVLLTLGPDNYWMFGRYGSRPHGGDKEPLPEFKSEPATLDGFDVPLNTTPFPNQYDAPGGLKPRLGGYHAWQSRDMKNWVHHGPITENFAKWMTTAEFADGKAYFYYDFPNDQDPHVYADADLFDGLPGENKGMAYDDPSHGSDCGVIRDLDGKFHLIVEDWTPIHAQ